MTSSPESADVVVIGGGVAGMSTAARLQSENLSTLVLEQHDHIGGCAGYYQTDDFTFDVGATTLVDFQPNGVGGQLLADIGLDPPDIEVQDAYDIWLPDRRVTLYHDQQERELEREAKLGDSEQHREFYAFVDELAETFWRITREGVKLPVQTPSDLVRNVRTIGIRDLPLVRYLRWTMADALRAHDVDEEQALRHLIAMLVEDTVHTRIEEAPLINAILGSTIRRAGISRTTGGMSGFWRTFEEHYLDLGGDLRTNHIVTEVTGDAGNFRIQTDPDRERLHGRTGEIISILADDAGTETGDERDDSFFESNSMKMVSRICDGATYDREERSDERRKRVFCLNPTGLHAERIDRAQLHMARTLACANSSHLSC